MDAKSRAIDLLLLVFQALDFLYFPGRTVFGRGGYRFSSLEMARSVHYLTRRGLVEKRRDAEGWVYALTASGRQRLNRGIDPVARWNRRWDGRWRQVIFDLPARKKALRARLLRWLRANRFGYLQDSVWITPDPLDLSHSAFRDLGMMADMAVFMDSRVLSEEDRLWWAALDTDPLLPKPLYLEAYPGISALNARKKFFRSLRKRA